MLHNLGNTSATAAVKVDIKRLIGEARLDSCPTHMPPLLMLSSSWISAVCVHYP
jgi:hypothetical protein